MQTMTRRALGLAGLGLILSASAAWAQQAPPVRVRGEITKVEGNTLSVKSRDGQSLMVKLAQPARIAAMVKASLADIKEGSFIGVSAMPQPDGTQKAYAVHIFMDSQKGVVADRFGPWDSRPGSTMTNANVASTVASKDGQNLLVKYKDGEKKVVVPPGTTIARYLPGSAADLKVGAKVFVAAAKKEADGSLTAPNIAVGRDIDPPQ
jgi:outer membrane lipoprotein SlyB